MALVKIKQPISLESRLDRRLDDVRTAIEWHRRGDDKARLLVLADEMVTLMR